MSFNLKEEWRQKELEEVLLEEKGSQTYLVPINWILTPYRLDRTKGVLVFGKGRHKMFLGFCMATEQLIKMMSANGLGTLTVLLVKDTYVTSKEGKAISCEEERRCLNIDCPINRTTKESFKLSMGMSEKSAKKMRWEAVTSYRNITWKEVSK